MHFTAGGRARPLEVIPMSSPFLKRILISSVLTAVGVITPLFGQEVPPASSVLPQVAATPASAPAPVAKTDQIVVPTGTRLPLLLRNGVNTRTAKPGDSVYFETAYPIAANNRMAIPMGTFVRGEILEAKRPGRIRGRGELRMAIEQMTYPNGYTIELRASPSSVDPNSGSGVNTQKTIEGPSSSMRDTTAVLLTTAGGAYIGAVAGAVSNGAPGKGALIGGGAGGLGALIAVLATRGPEAELPRGTTMDVVFDRPLVLDTAYLPSAVGAGTDPQPRYSSVPADGRQRQKEIQKKRLEHSMLRSILFFPF